MAGNGDLELRAKRSGGESVDADALEVRAYLAAARSSKDQPGVVRRLPLTARRRSMPRAGRGSPVESILKGPEGRRSLSKPSVQRLQAAKYDYSILV